MAAKEQPVLMTREGLKKLEEEVEYLRTIKRKEVAEKIKQARDYGDLSENFEYDEAKNEQAFTEGRILQIEEMLKKVEVVESEDLIGDIVNVGTKVKVLDLEFNEEVEYIIVGPTEADPFENKISNESPVGRSLVGHKVDEIIKVEVPDGFAEYKILEVSKPENI